MEKEKVKKLSHFSATLKVIRNTIWKNGDLLNGNLRQDYEIEDRLKLCLFSFTEVSLSLIQATNRSTIHQ